MHNSKFLILPICLVLLGILLFNSAPVYGTEGIWSALGSTIYYNDGVVGLGTDSFLDSSAKLELTKNDYNEINITSHGISVDPSYVSYRSRGSRSTPSVLASGDALGGFFARGYDGTNYVNSAGLRFYVDGTAGTGDMPGRIEFHTSNDGTTNFSEKARITQDGKFGINTQSPAANLHVKSNGGTFNLEGTDHTFVQWYPDGYVAGRKAWFGYGSGTTSDLTLSNEISGGNIVFTANAGSVLVDTVLKAKEIQVKSNVWADYVFGDDYLLMDLDEVEKYIDQNGHLPGVPSEAEVKKNGISVGDMQRVQMEKIEELMLYVIQLDKENQALKARVDGIDQK